MFKRLAFFNWAEYTSMKNHLRSECWRKIKAWYFYTYKVAKKRREFFRCCFWPYFVWRRWAVQYRTAREKAKFLITRVLPTYNTMHIFRAWQKYAAFAAAGFRKAANCYVNKLLKRARKELTFWHEWTVSNKRVRKLWLRDGLEKMQHAVLLCKTTPFQVWRGYVEYIKLVRERVPVYTLPVRRLLTGNKAMHKPKSLKERKALFQERMNLIKAVMEERKKKREEAEKAEKLAAKVDQMKKSKKKSTLAAQAAKAAQEDEEKMREEEEDSKRRPLEKPKEPNFDWGIRKVMTQADLERAKREKKHYRDIFDTNNEAIKTFLCPVRRKQVAVTVNVIGSAMLKDRTYENNEDEEDVRTKPRHSHTNLLYIRYLIQTGIYLYLSLLILNTKILPVTTKVNRA